MRKENPFSKMPEQAKELWQAYLTHRNTDGDYDVRYLSKFVIELWSIDIVLNLDELLQLIQTSGISSLNEDSVADEVEATLATLRILEKDYSLKVPKK